MCDAIEVEKCCGGKQGIEFEVDGFSVQSVAGLQVQVHQTFSTPWISRTCFARWINRCLCLEHGRVRAMATTSTKKCCKRALVLCQLRSAALPNDSPLSAGVAPPFTCRCNSCLCSKHVERHGLDQRVELGRRRRPSLEHVLPLDN